MTDVLAWTDEGRKALAEEDLPTLRDATEDELDQRITRTASRFGPCWERGLPECDEAGRAAVALARGEWDVQSLDAANAAAIASLLGARSEDDGGAFAELLLRRRGVEFALRTLVEAWSLRTGYHDPDWPDSEARLAIHLTTVAADHSSSQDASVSYGKGDLARYLAARLDGSNEAREAARAMWRSTPLHARAPLAAAAGDTELAEDIARDLLEGKTASYPHFAWQVLPALIRDPALVKQLREKNLLPFTYRWLAALGAAALPHYEAVIDSRKIGKWQRERMIAQLVNVRGPKAAAILARYASKSPFKKSIRTYFTRFSELAPILANTPQKPRKGSDL